MILCLKIRARVYPNLEGGGVRSPGVGSKSLGGDTVGPNQKYVRSTLMCVVFTSFEIIKPLSAPVTYSSLPNCRRPLNKRRRVHNPENQ